VPTASCKARCTRTVSHLRRIRSGALQSSARVNEAYTALKDPVSRAQYLLSLRGIDAFAEIDTSLPFDFLEQQLEHREAASRAFEARDVAAAERVLAAVRSDYETLERELEACIDARSDWEAARTRVRELKFLAKLAGDIDAMLGELD
jgi:molecular chaperone HscB